jgi:uncharacterized protein YqjF (DUF2071 family)
MRQWWGRLLFMHWPLPPALLRPLLPPQLSVDTYDGSAWIGVVPFAMWGVRPYFTPALPGLSSFHELNVRTYVHHEGVPGVWFFSLDINSLLATWGARQFFHLPYYVARTSMRHEGRALSYSSSRVSKDAPPAAFDADWSYGERLQQSEPGSLEFFLTERYCLYSSHAEQLYRCRIFHPAWPLRAAEVSRFRSTMVEALGLPTPDGEPLLHYADELKVDIFPLLRVRQGTRDRLFEAANAAEPAA